MNTILFERVCFPTLHCFDTFLSVLFFSILLFAVRVKMLLVLFRYVYIRLHTPSIIRTGTVDYPMLGTGMTPLMTAAASGWKDGCFELIRNDASLTVSSTQRCIVFNTLQLALIHGACIRSERCCRQCLACSESVETKRETDKEEETCHCMPSHAITSSSCPANRYDCHGRRCAAQQLARSALCW